MSSAWIEGLMAPRREPARDGRPPTADELATILAAATTVPDHGGLRPWRFVVIGPEARPRFGDALVAGLIEMRGAEVPESMVAKMRGKSTTAPASIMVISSPDRGSNVELWEQEASAACAGYAMVLAATQMGLGAQWKSAPVLGTVAIAECFALTQGERPLGWINLGSFDPERPLGARPLGGADKTTYLAPIS